MKQIGLRLFFVLVVLLLANGSALAQDDWGDEEQTDSLALDESDSLDAAEICFRDVFQTRKSDRKAKFFSIGWEHVANNRYIDPDDDFMFRFKDVRPKVKTISYYYNNLKKTKDKTVLCYMGEITKVDRYKIEVHCGYWESDTRAAGHLYIVEMIDGEWQITSSAIEWMI
ncbi:MAG: hypothetical protein KDC92_02760 [Bacteroidetes bacterium]|nr:hypothetical protein [Bacteroidota bacterium]